MNQIISMQFNIEIFKVTIVTSLCNNIAEVYEKFLHENCSFVSWCAVLSKIPFYILQKDSQIQYGLRNITILQFPVNVISLWNILFIIQ
jgi:hypothetical protein